MAAESPTPFRNVAFAKCMATSNLPASTHGAHGKGSRIARPPVRWVVVLVIVGSRIPIHVSVPHRGR
eukprot:scaffold173733_cov35-Tisochrysis_lutea.AAC.3